MTNIITNKPILKWREFPYFSNDRQHSCLFKISCYINIVPPKEPFGTPDVVATDISYTIYPKYTEYEFGGYNGDLKHYFYYRTASEAARKINTLLKEPGRFTHMDMKLEVKNIIAQVRHNLNKEAHKSRMDAFMSDFKQLIDKYGLTIKPYEAHADYGDRFEFYELHDGFDYENLEDIVHDIINETIQEK